MTSVYVPERVEGYEFCHPVKSEDLEAVNSLINGAIRSPEWKPIDMRIVNSDQGNHLLESDCPWLGTHALLFNSRAAETHNNVLSRYGELLPLHCSERPGLFVYNPTMVIDALDIDRSSFMTISSGKIVHIRSYSFREDAIGNCDIFKIPNLRVSPTFVSERFVELYKSSGLKGLEFRSV